MKQLFIFLCALLTACGGGGSEMPRAPVHGVVLGDSTTSGSMTLPDGSVSHLAVPPVARLNELSKGAFVITDLAMPGMVSVEALSGGYRWMDMGPNPSFEAVLKTKDASFVLLRFGTADALRGISPEMFRASMHALIQMSLKAGKKVILVEPIHQLPNVAAKADALCAIVHDLSISDGVPLIPVRDLPWTLIDGVHSDQETSDLQMGRIVERLVYLL